MGGTWRKQNRRIKLVCVQTPLISSLSSSIYATRSNTLSAHGRRYSTPWPDSFIPELRRALVACKVFLFYPIFWVIYNQLPSNFVAQAGQMRLHGLPNDELQNIDPLTIIVFIPILDRLVYPCLRRYGYPMYPITRITCGFVCAGISMAVAAVVQHQIYISPPNYNMPTVTTDSGGASAGERGGDGSGNGNDIHVAFQAPGYLFIALAEIFASITGLEYAFTKAPASMKSFIMGVFLFTSAGGSVLGIGVSKFARDPGFVWFYSGLCVVDVGATVAFWKLYGYLNDLERGMNAMEGDRGKRYGE